VTPCYPLSRAHGQGFTGNGDVLAFAYNCDRAINGIGLREYAAGEIPSVGPCIAGIIDLREQPVLENGIVIEEGVIPGGMSTVIAHVFGLTAKLTGEDTDDGVVIDTLGREGWAAMVKAAKERVDVARRELQKHSAPKSEPAIEFGDVAATMREEFSRYIRRVVIQPGRKPKGEPTDEYNARRIEVQWLGEPAAADNVMTLPVAAAA
jgi:hypothetical protein